MWDCGLWWERERYSWNKYWHSSGKVMASWGFLFLQVGMVEIWGSGGEAMRTSMGRAEVMNGHHRDSLVQFHCEVVAPKSVQKHGVGQK